MSSSSGYSRTALIEMFGRDRGETLATQSPYSQYLAVRAFHSRRPRIVTIRPNGLVANLRYSPTPVPVFG